MTSPDHQDQTEFLSKSQRKRDMLALQDLGRELTEAPVSLLAQIQLPENLAQAIAEYKRLPNKHEARRRQLQFIGKLMRDVDTTEIRTLLEKDRQQANVDKRKHQELEKLRDSLLQEDVAAMTLLLERLPQVEIQHVRQLIRQARKEQEANKPPAASRKLFRYLRDLS